jgi:acyl-CoA thioesterase YciA|tara:strand:+ start:6348 stop:6806 length:459 start_codon:yes stop_codon:yes gene_type:complete
MPDFRRSGVSLMAEKKEIASNSESQIPRGELCTRTLAMPSDTNPDGDIFGGWLMSQMDIAGGVLAGGIAKGRVVTISVDGMTFLRPVYVGDVVCVYGDVERLGNTSMVLSLEAWVLRRRQAPRIKVTEGRFTFVAIDDAGRPRAIPKDEATA